MDHKFTEQVGQWLNSREDDRDYKEGALMLLRLSGNQIMYLNNIRCLESRKDFITYQLQKYYNFRVQSLTHEQVEEMAAQVVSIVQEHSLSEEQPSVADDSKKLGKRDDHDLLPDDIQAKYRENFSILQHMRELHLKLRSLSLENAPCPDSERYPFLKELISLDKKLHKNWEEYDHYVLSDTTSNQKSTKKTPTKRAAKK